MKSLLVDVDGVYNNIALERISCYEKSQGNEVILKRCNIPIFPKKQKSITVDCCGFDKIYVSAIFEGTFKFVTFANISDSAKVLFGGTGINIKSQLPREIKNCKRDYSLYPDMGIGYAFISRGCPNICKHCVVPEKEG